MKQLSMFKWFAIYISSGEVTYRQAMCVDTLWYDLRCLKNDVVAVEEQVARPEDFRFTREDAVFNVQWSGAF